jgi:hypothetical protein
MIYTLRHTLSVFVTLALISAFPNGPASAQGSVWGGPLNTAIWGVPPSQTLRICMIFVVIPNIADAPAASTDKRKQSLYFPEMMNQSGEVLLQAELSVPAGEFRCVDISYDELLRAGLEPDPTTGALSFRVRIRADSQDGNRTESVGAIMNLDSLTGKVELYQSIDGSWWGERL